VGFLTRFVLFWYDFIVGDDWVVAVGVVLALLLSYLLAHGGAPDAAWLVMLLAVPLVVAISLWRVVRAA
jgi:hypothetical protein